MLVQPLCQGQKSLEVIFKENDVRCARITSFPPRINPSARNSKFPPQEATRLTRPFRLPRWGRTYPVPPGYTWYVLCSCQCSLCFRINRKLCHLMGWCYPLVVSLSPCPRMQMVAKLVTPHRRGYRHNSVVFWRFLR